MLIIKKVSNYWYSSYYFSRIFPSCIMFAFSHFVNNDNKSYKYGFN